MSRVGLGVTRSFTPSCQLVQYLWGDKVSILVCGQVQAFSSVTLTLTFVVGQYLAKTSSMMSLVVSK